MEKLIALGNTESFTREQLLSFSQILHAGLHAVRFVEIEALLVQLDDPGHLTSGATPFEEPTPFGVTPQQCIQAPPAVNTFSFVHGMDFQSACEILREGQVRPSPLPPGGKAEPCVVYGSGTAPKATTKFVKANWGSVQDEAYICRRRGFFRNPALDTCG